jgi:hypothetical protein
MADQPIHIAGADAFAARRTRIKCFNRFASGGASSGGSCQRDHVAVGDCGDADQLLDQCQVCVVLTQYGRDKPIVVERHNGARVTRFKPSSCPGKLYSSSLHSGGRRRGTLTATARGFPAFVRQSCTLLLGVMTNILDCRGFT